MTQPEEREVRGIPCVIFAVEHGSYNRLEYLNGGYTLYVRHGDFVHATYLTLYEWRRSVKFPKVFRPLKEIAAAVTVLEYPHQKHPKPQETKIPLNGNSSIEYHYNGQQVIVPRDQFIFAAVTHLAEEPTLDLRTYYGEYQREILVKWENFLQDLKFHPQAA